jgi:hypothetical protein
VDNLDELDVGIGMDNGDSSFTLSAKALMDLLMANKAPDTVSHPTYPAPQIPRVGGLNR